MPSKPTPRESAAASQRAIAAKQDSRRDDAVDNARKQRTQDYLAKERAREAVLKKQGYCF